MPTSKEPYAYAEQDASHDAEVEAGYSQEVGGTSVDEVSFEWMQAGQAQISLPVVGVDA